MLDEPLFTRSQSVNLQVCNEIEHYPCEPLTLKVSTAPPYTDASGLMFGVSTTLKRLEDSIPQFQRWLSNNGAMLLVLVVDHMVPSLEEIEAKLEKAGIIATLVKANPNIMSAQQHFSIVEELYNHKRPDTKWMGIIDDDTFFPSIPNLLATLAKYDHNQPHYIGALSEDWNAVRLFGFMAFGGGGIFLSTPLTEQIHNGYGECLQMGERMEGDVILRDCIYAKTRTKLSLEPDFHQIDLEHDVSGFYESGVFPLSIHHYKSWYQMLPEKMHLVAEVCGECFLQRWQFADNTLLTNAYSAVHYPLGIDFDTELVEGTWAHPNHEYDFSLGPLRPAMTPEKKVSWKFLDAEVRDDGAVKQLYVHRGMKGKEDEVLELVWTK
ncbi:hypothetical protein MMC16_003406 [Acarospora aff. strigata]|nr:hypothetical protein [Acarospora aff. strigata]